MKLNPNKMYVNQVTATIHIPDKSKLPNELDYVADNLAKQIFEEVKQRLYIKFEGVDSYSNDRIYSGTIYLVETFEEE